jgi:hypothetical protein
MKRKIIGISICFLFLLMALPSATSLQVKEKTKPAIIASEGNFNAELGFSGNQNPFASLDGQYRTRGRFVGFSGTASVGDKNGRFIGFFRAGVIILQLPVRGRTLTIFGVAAFDQDHTNFRGIWRARGYRAGGWITGSLS